MGNLDYLWLSEVDVFFNEDETGFIEGCFWICEFLDGLWVVGTLGWYYPYSVLGMPSLIISLRKTCWKCLL